MAGAGVLVVRARAGLLRTRRRGGAAWAQRRRHAAARGGAGAPVHEAHARHLDFERRELAEERVGARGEQHSAWGQAVEEPRGDPSRAPRVLTLRGRMRPRGSLRVLMRLPRALGQ